MTPRLLRRLLQKIGSRESNAADSEASPYRIRLDVAGLHLSGRGIEIGGGAHPQDLPTGADAVLFDIRSRAELVELFGNVPDAPIYPIESIPEHFPDGAPFLIAHHVLEHTPDPIGTLCRWHDHVADAGVVVLSLPDKNTCPDEPRLEPPFTHLLYDYLLERGAHAFESKEHALSNNLGWIDQAPTDLKTLPQAAAWLLSHLYERNPDVHWHAFTQSLSEKTVLAAVHFGGFTAELLAKADFTTTTVRTQGDIILVYRLHRRPGLSTGFRYDIAAELEQIDSALRKALERVGARPRSKPQPVLAQRGESYPAWIIPEDRPNIIDLRPPFRRESGHCFLKHGLITLMPGDTPDRPTQSNYALFEDGVRLGPAHAVHDDIRRRGSGRFSHWQITLYFSTRDNTDPNTNGRQYRLSPTQLEPGR